MVCLSRRLESSVAACWRARTAGTDDRSRNWQTRVGYYTATLKALARADAADIDIGDILAAHAYGRQSTAYSIASNSCLVRFYRAQPAPSDRRIGDLVTTEPAQHILAEAKVWSFWPKRTAWVLELDERFPGGPFKTAAQRLAQAVVRWQAANPALAASQGGLLPLCAIEDLVILGRGKVTAAQAAGILAAATPSGDLELPGDFRCPRGPAWDDTAVGDIVTRVESAVGLLGTAAEHGPVVSLLRSALRDLAALSRGETVS